MKKRLVWLSLLSLTLVLLSISCRKQAAEEKPSDKIVPASEFIAQADQLYAQREDLARVREGITALKRARATEHDNYEAAWRLAKFDYYLGSHTKDGSERDKAFDEGIAAGKDAIKLQDNKPEGHFWRGANLGGQAQASVLGGLSSVDDIRAEMQRVIQIDEGYLSGSAYMVLGQVDLEAPKMLGGDPKRALENLEKGLKLGPENQLLRVNLAKAYLANDRKAEAIKTLQAIINAQPDPNYLPEHKDAVAQAQKLLDENK